MLYEKNIPKIIICPTCEGECVVSVGNLREMHNHDTEPCTDCDAKGKVWRFINIKYEKL